MTDKIFNLIATMDSHFAADDQSPADRARWLVLKRHLIGMKDALDLVRVTLSEERERGIPLTAETGLKLEGYVRRGLER
jgi:hypothetical protein